MSDYRVATGTDISLGSLTVLSPQPRSGGIQYTRRTFAADGTPTSEGAYVVLTWDILGSKAQYQSLLTTFGLSSASAAEVTVYARDENYDYVRKNGLAIKPVPGEGVDWKKYFPRNLTILVRNLEDAS